MAYRFLCGCVTQTPKGMLWEQSGSHHSTFYEKTSQRPESVFLFVSAVTLRKSENAVNHFGRVGVLKRESACSRHHFIGSPSSCCREKGSETAWFKCWCVCLKRCKRVRSRVDEWRDIHRGSPKFTKEPQSNLCPESEPRGIQLILWLWKVEALLHSLRMSTWTCKLTCINVSFMYNELHCVRPQGRKLGRKLGYPLGEWQEHISRGHKCPE